MPELQNDSPIGRLLEELSWEGNARKYRNGGRGMENVLVTEVFATLDLLPREIFLGALLRAAHGARGTLSAAAAGVEQARIQVLPGGPDLAPGGPNIQPDVVLEMPGATVLIEAKRPKYSAFQPEQLAREYLCLLRDFPGPTRLLLLILGAPPPIRVRGLGTLSISDAISTQLPTVLAKATPKPPLDLLEASMTQSCAWITWAEIDAIVNSEATQFADPNASVATAVGRGAAAVRRFIAWHS